MNRFAAVIAVVSLTSAVASAQNPNATKIYTQPKAPSWEMLRRLDLYKAFHIHVKTNGRRDGIMSIDVIPHKDGTQLLVQTYYGRVMLIDGENGDVLWTTAVGIPYREAYAPTYNLHSIFATRRDKLFVLNRKNGLHRVFTIDPDSKIQTLGFELALAPSSRLTAGEQIIYVNQGARIVAYTIPDFGLVDELKEKRKKKGNGNTPDPVELAATLQPEYLWGYSTVAEVLTQPPVLTAGQVGVIGRNGRFLSLNRFEPKLRFTFKASSEVSKPMGHYKDFAYIPTDDSNVYSVNIVNGDLTWRFLAEGAITEQIVATNKDVFVAPLDRGLVRLDRKTGMTIWRQPRAVRYLSGSEKFVYAVNERKQLLVIGYPRGAFLACFDMSKWIVPVTNHWTDRMYFAANDGQILCLRNRDNRDPVWVKTVGE